MPCFLSYALTRGKEKMSETYEIEISADDADERIDAYLSSKLEGVTRSYLQKLIDSGDIAVAGREKLAKNYKLRSGDHVTVRIPEPEKLEVTAEDIPLDIVYEDSDILVVNKPKGMVVHPAVGNMTGTLVNAIMYHCKDNLSSINGIVRPGIVHRIDKDTSGLLVVAKNDAAHKALAEQFSVHSIKRAYHAVVYNNLKEDQGTIDAYIGRNPKDRLKMAVTGPENGRRAVTHYKVLARSGKFTYVECTLETGRTHQIRVHMAYINHPLAGDPLYGPKKGVAGITDGQVLHAKTLGFVHPGSREYVEFDSELPASFLAALKKTGLK